MKLRRYLLLGMLCFAQFAAAQSFPSKPIRLFAPFAPGGAGAGSPHHLAAELFKSLTGIQAEHVPYKGSGPALADLMAGNLDFISVEYTAAEPHVKNGKLKALALATRERAPGIDLPTVAEAGFRGFEVTSWYAIFGPAGMPGDVTQ